MDYSSLTFGLDVLVSVVFGAGGALGVYFKVKGRLDLLQVEFENLKTEGEKFEAMTNTRIKNLKEIVKENRERSDKSIDEIKQVIYDTKLEIIKEIHSNK